MQWSVFDQAQLQALDRARRSCSPVCLTADQTVIFSQHPAVQPTDVTTKQPGAAFNSCGEMFKIHAIHPSAWFPAQRECFQKILPHNLNSYLVFEEECYQTRSYFWLVLVLSCQTISIFPTTHKSSDVWIGSLTSLDQDTSDNWREGQTSVQDFIHLKTDGHACCFHPSARKCNK